MSPQGMLRGLAEGLGLRHVAGPGDALVKGVACDSRKVEPGSVFVAVPGHAVDGHEFVAEALRRGAAAVVVQEGRESALPARPRAACFTATDARRVAGALARSYRANPDLDLSLVAVTGTNGKTTVSHLVRSLLDTAGRPCGLLGTLRYETGRRSLTAPLTTPDPCAFYGFLEEMRDAGLNACAFEASSHALDQERLGPVEVDVAAFTNLTREHLDYHGTMEGYLAAKLRLLDHLVGEKRDKERGAAVVFHDDPRLASVDWPEHTLKVGTSEACELRLLQAHTGREGSRLRVRWQGREVELRTRLLGAFNVENALVALGCAAALGLSDEDLAEGLAQAEPVPGRMEPLPVEGGPLVLIDYAHTPDGLEKSLATCRQLTSARLHLVFGCGGDRDRGKRPLMAQVAARGADRIYLTLDNPRTEDPARIFADVEAGMEAARAEGRARTIADRAEAVGEALAQAGPDDLVLIAGKGHETYQILGTEKVHWDDREAVRRARSRGGAP